VIVVCNVCGGGAWTLGLRFVGVVLGRAALASLDEKRLSWRWLGWISGAERMFSIVGSELNSSKSGTQASCMQSASAFMAACTQLWTKP